jgi:hypothetical protein
MVIKMNSRIGVALVVVFILLLQSCIVSRTERPKLTGYVVDSDSHKPVVGCKVGDVYTDTVGYYQLKEKRYTEFAFPGMEAPPLNIYEIVTKRDYVNDTIMVFSPYGGGSGKGAHLNIDTIFLKKRVQLKKYNH